MATLLSIHLKRLYPNWNIVEKHTEYHPEEMSIIDEYKKTPLHYLFRRPKHVPFFIVQKFIKHYPDATKQQDNFHQTPFLLACWSKAPIEILKLLLDEYVEAAWVPDVQMRYPIEILADNNCNKEIWEKIKLLLNVFPKCSHNFQSSNSFHSSIRNSAPSLLHIACASPTPFEIIQYIIEIHPDMMSKQDEFGNIPLFYAVSNPNIDFKIIEHLLLHDHNQNSLQIRNNQGALALHLAIENNMKYWKHIFDAYPDAIYLKHDQSDLLPFMISASIVNENDVFDESSLVSFNTLYELILLSPDLIKSD